MKISNCFNFFVWSDVSLNCKFIKIQKSRYFFRVQTNFKEKIFAIKFSNFYIGLLWMGYRYLSLVSEQQSFLLSVTQWRFFSCYLTISYVYFYWDSNSNTFRHILKHFRVTCICYQIFKLRELSSDLDNFSSSKQVSKFLELL